MIYGKRTTPAQNPIKLISSNGMEIRQTRIYENYSLNNSKKNKGCHRVNSKPPKGQAKHLPWERKISKYCQTDQPCDMGIKLTMFTTRCTGTRIEYGFPPVSLLCTQTWHGAAMTIWIQWMLLGPGPKVKTVKCAIFSKARHSDHTDIKRFMKLQKIAWISCALT